MNKKEKDYYMREAMRTFGSAFIQALAECLERADTTNYGRLEMAFPEYIAQYRRKANENKNL